MDDSIAPQLAKPNGPGEMRHPEVTASAGHGVQMSDFDPPPFQTSEDATPVAPAQDACLSEASTGWRPRKVLAGSMVAVVLAFGIGFGIGNSTSDSTDRSVTADADSDGDAAEAVETDDPAPPANESATIGVDDVAVGYRVLEEDCFNSAGSLMQVELSPGRAPGSDLSLDEMSAASFLVTYDITNTEGGVTRGSIMVEQGRFNSEVERLSFPRCNTNPNIVVTDVVER